MAPSLSVRSTDAPWVLNRWITRFDGCRNLLNFATETTTSFGITEETNCSELLVEEP
jgi:hypothetical protein